MQNIRHDVLGWRKYPKPTWRKYLHYG